MDFDFASVEEAEELSRLMLAAVSPHRETDFDDRGWQRFLGAASAAQMKDRLRDEDYLVLRSKTGDRITGFITLYRFAKIDQLFVLPNYQRRGVASRLWCRARDLAVDNGTRQFWVRSSTLAVPVYARFGFRAVGGRQTEGGIRFHRMELALP
ncbi:GNAT family N-acetyltransferase [Gilvimarinus sp. F26214L]|uniref:GNAT family N-acetyltransferase n=1 Tax=Gilvimarinus sp. DZF01 TaxID=3461371 RepID=UPI0040456FFF